MWGLEAALEALQKLIAFLFILCVIFVPLGIWKLVELIIWVVQHVSVNVN